MDAGLISSKSKVLFVDDGSQDSTWEIICSLHEENPAFTGIRLSRNQGEQTAVLAGLTIANEACDLAVTIDADLQDDINVIDQMIDAYLQGYDIVYANRQSRATDSFMKRATAIAFYKVARWLDTGIEYNNGGYRLLSKRAIRALLQYQESGLFLNGLLARVGFRSTAVFYDRAKRAAGQTHYSYRKIIDFALDGIISFSSKPIHMIGVLSICLLLASVVLGVFALVRTCLHAALPWMWILFAICFFGSLQLLAIGIVGEYVAKTLWEAKKRPLFLIEENLN